MEAEHAGTYGLEPWLLVSHARALTILHPPVCVASRAI